MHEAIRSRYSVHDPVVQAPYNTQNYNRYSYVLNNPLSLVDPTGYCYGDFEILSDMYMDEVEASTRTIGYVMDQQRAMFEQVRLIRQMRDAPAGFKVTIDWSKVEDGDKEQIRGVLADARKGGSEMAMFDDRFLLAGGDMAMANAVGNVVAREQKGIEGYIKKAQRQLQGKSFGEGEEGMRKAFVALDGNENLKKVAALQVEPWAVIGGDNNTILAIGSGKEFSTSYKATFAYYKHVQDGAHIMWHRHPKGSDLWYGDLKTATVPGQWDVIAASGNNGVWYWNNTGATLIAPNPAPISMYGRGVWVEETVRLKQ